MVEQPSTPGSTRHGDRDVNVRAILIAGIVFVVAAVAIQVGIWWMLRVMVDDARRQDPPKLNTSTETSDLPASYPELQDGVATKSPAEEMKAWKTEESERIVEYSWVDKDRGIVRIPVDEAMRFVLAEGLPSRDDAPATPGPGEVAAAAASTEGGTQ